MKYFVYTAIGVVAAAIIVGFFVAESPREVRLRRLDERRISNLQDIRWQAQNFWDKEGRLPDSLSELRATSEVPVDPETGSDYEYNVKSETVFELCAAFSLQSPDDPYTRAYPVKYGPFDDDWRHGAGRVCFERQIGVWEEGEWKPVPAERVIVD